MATQVDAVAAHAAASTPGSPGPDTAYAVDLFVVHAAADAEFVHGYLVPALNLPPARLLLIDDVPAGKTAAETMADTVAEIDRRVTSSRFTAAVLSPAYLADRWAQLGERLATALSVDDARIIPLQLADCQLPLHLKAKVSLDFRSRAAWDGEAARLRDMLHTPSPPPEDIPCPYPGMRPFRASDASVFFGRDQELHELIERLDRGEREIYVIGPSGSGKSSLVQAGLIHALDKGASALGHTFLARTMRPGDRPADRLAKIFDDSPASPVASNGAAPIAANPIDALLAHHAPAERVLVFIDQLEELFTLADAAERQRFLVALRALRAESRCYLLLALRADFYGAVMDSALWQDLAGHMVRVDVPPLRGPALAQAILQPAAQVGVYLEARLCDRLVADAADEPGALPLVQETLRLLWEHRRRRLIGVAEYDALGETGHGTRHGLDVAIVQHADAAMAELGEAQRTIARRVLLRLVSFGDGRLDTRRQQPVEALRSAADDAAAFTAVLQHLVDQRLVTVDDSEPHAAVADLAHEALISAWPALSAWIDERRVDEQRRRQLEARVAGWVAHGRGEAGLLDRVELSEARRWLASDAARELGYAAELSALVAASQTAVDEADRQRRRRTMTVIAGLAALAVLASVLGLVEARRRRDAQDRARADTLQLGLNYLDQGRGLLFDGHPLRALPYLVAAREHGIDEPMLGTLFETALRSAPRVTLIGHTSRVRAAALSPDGHRAVTASEDKTARIWNAETGEPVGQPLQHGAEVIFCGFSPDGTRVATAGADFTARIWDASTGVPVTPPLRHGLSIYMVSFSADGKRVATASGDRTGRVWNAATGEPVTPPLPHDGIVWSVALSPDGKRVATSGVDHTARIWNAVTGEPIATLHHGNVVWSVVFSGDGKYVATASSDDTAQVWDAATGRPVTRPLQHAGTVREVVFFPDAQSLITASSDRTAQMWNVNTGDRYGTPLSHPDGVSGVAISRDGKRIVTTCIDGNARVWDEASSRLIATIEHPRDLNSAMLSADGERVITACNDGTARIWDAAPAPATPRLQLRGEAGGRPFSPDGTRIVTAGPAEVARVWSAIDGTQLSPPLAHTAQVTVAAFSPDGTRVVTGGKDSTARVWDAWTGRPVTPPMRNYDGDDWNEQGIRSVEFSPDGTRVMTVGQNAVLRQWDARTGAQIASPIEHAYAVQTTYSPDGLRILTASEHMVEIWDAITSARLLPPLEEPSSITAAAYSPDGLRVVTAGWDKGQLWDARTGARIGAPMDHDSNLTAAAYSFDGAHVVTASADRTVRLWDGATGKSLGPPLVHPSMVMTAGFSPDGQRVLSATGSPDRSIRIWDVATGKLLGPPLVGDGSSSFAVFSPDGRRVATRTAYRTSVWTVAVDMAPLAQWQQLARCSPFVLGRGGLLANLAPTAICRR